ncbi:MAG: energy-coupling factor ABC transporter ATP-binding protein [Clostridiales bacterium]|nr:energy-coupling factor ABC transporter ATP-binding protein [Clostridiales bacterium]
MTGEMSESVVQAQELTFAYESVQPTQARDVLSMISFSIREGEAVGIIGGNGAGKSTLLKLLVGLMLSYRGSLKVYGLDVDRGNLKEIRRRVGYVFQDSDSQLFMPTVYADVSFAPRNYGLAEEQVQACTMEALSRVGMEEQRDRHIYQLSGGQKKLAAIAGILAMDQKLILMDEPSAALDPKNRRNLIRLINELEAGKIIASHDLDFVLDTCSRVILLDRGRLIADGPADEILRDRELLEAHSLELPLSLYGNGAG